MLLIERSCPFALPAHTESLAISFAAASYLCQHVGLVDFEVRFFDRFGLLVSHIWFYPPSKPVPLFM
jgi:hypothetical protein